MNVFDLAAILTLNSSQYDSALADAKNNAQEFGGSFGKIGKMMATGLAAGTAALSAVAGMAVSSYANYEQLAGGVKKLYQGASDEVMQYAQNAYKTSGMSANQYMEQATSFSAALVNSLDGDFSAAAKQTDVAMRAISDNWNTFGGDLSMIQGAFQGFAKQNYTMLDNLKLGYGGTKSEMERLIADANKYAEANGKAADLSIDSFSDVVTAIQYVQEAQHIAGTTAKEASTTIEGSINAAKSAWENLLTGFADSEQNIGELASTFADTFVTAAGNVIPRFIEAFQGIVEGVPQIITSLRDSFVEHFADFGTVGTEMMNGIISGISENATNFINMALPMITEFTESLRSNAGKLVDVGLALITNLAQGIINAFPTIVAYLPVMVTNIAGIINDNAPKILMTGVKLIGMLLQGIISAIPTIVENIPQIIEAIVSVFFAFNWASIGRNLVKGIAKGVTALGGFLRNAMNRIANAGMKQIVHTFASARSAGANMVKALGQAISSGLGAMKTAALRIAKGAIDTIKNAFTGVADIGMNLVRGIWSGISGGLGWIKSQISGWVGNVKSFLKSLFGINSPSKWAADVIGLGIDEGIAKGIDDNTSIVERAMDGLLYEPEIGTVGMNDDLFGSMKAVSMVNNITVDGAENPEEYAGRFVRQLQMDMRMI